MYCSWLCHSQKSQYKVKIAAILGADIEARDKDGYNPLLLAASEGNAEAVEILLRSQADIFVIDKEERTVLYWAAMQNHKNVIDVIFRFLTFLGSRSNFKI